MSGLGPPYREVEVPAAGAGLRLDRFLARWFRDRSRAHLAKAIRDGLVTDSDGKALRPSHTVREGDRLRIYVPGIAPSTPRPELPAILHEDDRLVVLDKPAGLPVHPAGTAFTWAVIGLARDRWPEVDLVHRLDRDTSGVLLLSKDPEANRFLKAELKRGGVTKVYEALCRGRIPWDHQLVDAPIGPAEGPIRIQMTVRPDGLPARTEVDVLDRNAVMTRVRCRLLTGRTHQIRVHLAHVAGGLVGDRMYGVPPEVFLHAWEHGVDESVIRRAGAPRHALHAARVAVAHPDGGEIDVHAPFPDDLARWWADPSVLPLDQGAS